MVSLVKESHAGPTWEGTTQASEDPEQWFTEVTSETVYPLVRDPEQRNSDEEISLYLFFIIHKVKEHKSKFLEVPSISAFL